MAFPSEVMRQWWTVRMVEPLTLTLDDLNALPAQDAAVYFRRCCSSEGWVSGMVKRRPFLDENVLQREAETV